MTSAGAAFRYRDFRSYMGARSLVRAASEMQAVVVAWQVYALTHQPLDLGLVGLTQFLPGVFLFLPAGHAADQFPRKRILQVTFAGFGVCSLLLLALTWQGVSSVYPIYAVLLINGVVRALHGPASQAILPQLVPEEDFPNAVAWNSSLFHVATVAGPLLGGLSYGWTGRPDEAYVWSAVSCFAGFVLVSMIRLSTVQRRPSGASLHMVLEGLRYIWRNKLVLGAISLDMFAVLLGGAVALLPVYAKEVLMQGAFGLGMLRSAPSVGAVAASLFFIFRPIRSKAGSYMLWCVFGFGLFTLVFGVSHNLAVSLGALFAMGACDMVSVIIRHTLVQLATPDEMRGRVSAVNGIFIQTSNELGEFESGVTAQWFGSVPAVILGGLGTIAVVAAWAWMFPSLRKVDTLTSSKV